MVTQQQRLLMKLWYLSHDIHAIPWTGYLVYGTGLTFSQATLGGLGPCCRLRTLLKEFLLTHVVIDGLPFPRRFWEDLVLAVDSVLYWQSSSGSRSVPRGPESGQCWPWPGSPCQLQCHQFLQKNNDCDKYTSYFMCLVFHCNDRYTQDISLRVMQR